MTPTATEKIKVDKIRVREPSLRAITDLELVSLCIQEEKGRDTL